MGFFLEIPCYCMSVWVSTCWRGLTYQAREEGQWDGECCRVSVRIMVDVPSKSRTRAMKTVLTTVLDVCGMLLGVRWTGGGDGQRYCMD
jgi:hypothetical protein